MRFDKPYFHGQETLIRLKAMTPRSRLVGFVMTNGDRLPEEGCQVVAQGRPVGRVTSARYSPTLGKNLGLAWVPASQATPGLPFQVRSHDADVTAVVASLPFYDPQGTRLRS